MNYNGHNLKMAHPKQFSCNKTHPKQKAGMDAEQRALNYLQAHGLDLLKRNYRTRLGEIDLIMLHQAYIVFVEVRYRKKNQYAQAAMSIDHLKQQKIIKAAKYYLMCSKQYNSHPCRFDVITVSSDLNAPSIEWIPNAFDLSKSF